MLISTQTHLNSGLKPDLTSYCVVLCHQGTQRNASVFHNMPLQRQMRNLTLCYVFVGVMATKPFHWLQREAEMTKSS